MAHLHFFPFQLLTSLHAFRQVVAQYGAPIPETVFAVCYCIKRWHCIDVHFPQVVPSFLDRFYHVIQVRWALLAKYCVGVSFFFGAHIRLGTILGRFSTGQLKVILKVGDPFQNYFCDHAIWCIIPRHLVYHKKAYEVLFLNKYFLHKLC